MEDALWRLDKLTQNEFQMATAQGLKATHSVGDGITAVDDKVKMIADCAQVISSSSLIPS
jgi:hypothetical protein